MGLGWEGGGYIRVLIGLHIFFGRVYIQWGLYTRGVLTGFYGIFVCSVYSKNKALRKEIPSKDLAVQRQPFPDFYKKGLLRIS